MRYKHIKYISVKFVQGVQCKSMQQLENLLIINLGISLGMMNSLITNLRLNISPIQKYLFKTLRVLIKSLKPNLSLKCNLATL